MQLDYRLALFQHLAQRLHHGNVGPVGNGRVGRAVRQRIANRQRPQYRSGIDGRLEQAGLERQQIGAVGGGSFGKEA